MYVTLINDYGKIKLGPFDLIDLSNGIVAYFENSQEEIAQIEYSRMKGIQYYHFKSGIYYRTIGITTE